MYPRRSRFSPERRPRRARQQLGVTICACTLVGSAVVMLGAFLLAGNFGVRQLVCSLIGSGAAVVFGICLLSLLPMLVRTMRAQLDQPGDAGPAIKTLFCIAVIALVAAASTTATFLPSILTTESRVASTSRRTRKTSSRNQQAPTTLSIKHVSSALPRPLSSSTTTHAVGS